LNYNKEIQLDYVGSGMSYIKLCGPAFKRGESSDILADTIGKIFESIPHTNFGLLYNAYTESDFGEPFMKMRSKVYVDSGGLQIITLKGTSPSEEVKQSIYETQTIGHYAMCFDEIPLYINQDSDNASARTQMTGKWVVGDEIYEKGVETGANIKKQVDHFRKSNAETKVFVILQGNLPEDWINFCKGVFSQLSEDDYPFLEGLALAGSCIGSGVLEAVDMYSIVPQLPCPEFLKKRLHLLGVGSISRLIPIIVMIRSGYLDKDTHVSYDSTSISAAHSFGRYLDSNGKTVKFDRCTLEEISSDTQYVVDDMLKISKELNWLDIVNLTEYEFAESFTGTTSLHFKDHIEYLCEIKSFDEAHLMRLAAYVIFFSAQVKTFVEIVNGISSSRKGLLSYIVKNKKLSLLTSLLDVTNYEDFLQWRSFAVMNNIPSNRIKRVQTHQDYLDDKKGYGLDQWLWVNVNINKKLNYTDIIIIK